MDLSAEGPSVRSARGALGRTPLGLRPPGRALSPPVLVLESSEAELEALAAALCVERAVTRVHAPRRAEPRRFGRPAECGHWLVGPAAAPDPHALFRVLAALEDLLAELGEDVRPWLIASGEGASVALALASCWGDRLGAVVAHRGEWLRLPDEVVRAPIEGLPMLWIHAGAAPSVADGRAELAARGARLELRAAGGADSDPTALADWLRRLAPAGEGAGRGSPGTEPR